MVTEQEQEGTVELSSEEKQKAKKALVDVAKDYNIGLATKNEESKIESKTESKTLVERLFGIDTPIDIEAKKKKKLEKIQRFRERKEKIKKYRAAVEEERFRTRIRQDVASEERAKKRTEPFHPENPFAAYSPAANSVFTPPTNVIIFEPAYQQQQTRGGLFHPIFNPMAMSIFSRATERAERRQLGTNMLSNPFFDTMASYSSNGKKNKGTRFKFLPPWLY